jgi:EmrB/QacA subfamily drug resistance transporter
MNDEMTLDRRRRLLVLFICCMSILVVSLDSTIVNVALPAIHRSLHASFSTLQWTIDAYTLVLASLLMLSGSTADRMGRRRIFQVGLTVFSLGSLLCALAPTAGLLVAARVLQAVGASMLNPVAMSIIRNVFEDARERAQAIGIWAGVVGISMALGPVLGGALVDGPGWRWVFLVNLPIGVLAFVLTRTFVPESRAPQARRRDPVGQGLVLTLLFSLTYAIIEGSRQGWTSPPIVALFVVALAAFIALVPYELRREEPLIEPRFFQSAPFAGASVIAICAFAALGGFLFLNTLYLQVSRGLSPLDAGLYTLPMALAWFVVGPVSGRMVGRLGPRPSLLIGGVAIAAGSLMLTRILPDTEPAYLFAAYAVLGVGLAMVNPPITNAAVTGMPAAQAGVASAVASTSRLVGVTLGVAVCGAIAGGTATAALGPDFAEATHPAWWLLGCLGAVVFVVGAATTSPWADATAARTAEQLA